MAVYKVPQDVEAEDKLIGPFSFRQFIYLLVAGLGIFTAWLLSQVFIGLFVLPMPIVIALLALALPLRKDQPMETYLIAMIKFFFKPRRRLWDPEGTISMIQITAPKVLEGPQMKDFAGDEASQRLSYLAKVMDTQGWSTRGATSSNDNLSDIFIAEASHAEDMFDESTTVTQSLEQKIVQADNARIQAVKAQMQQVAAQPQPTIPEPAIQTTPVQQAPVTLPTDATAPTFNPYPAAIHQQVLAPTQQDGGTDLPQAQKQPSAETVSPDIMRLANNNDLSISAISREARRLENNDDEVVISLR